MEGREEGGRELSQDRNFNSELLVLKFEIVSESETQNSVTRPQ